jgi:hypothetical protein
VVGVVVLGAVVFMIAPTGRPTPVRVIASGVFALGALGNTVPTLAAWFRGAPLAYSVVAAVPVGIATGLLFTRGSWLLATIVGGGFGALVGLLFARQRKSLGSMDGDVGRS